MPLQISSFIEPQCSMLYLSWLIVRVHTALESQGAGLIPARGPNASNHSWFKIVCIHIHAHLEVQKKCWNVFLLLVVYTFVKAVNALAHFLAHCVVSCAR